MRRDEQFYVYVDVELVLVEGEEVVMDQIEYSTVRDLNYRLSTTNNREV